MKSGYLYVLIHPSDPDLYKIGVTTLKPEKRLSQHNSNYEKYAGRIVRETGQDWKMKTFIEVPDPYHAESAFWGATPLSVVPYLGGIEVQKMEWHWVEAGLNAARKAGLRPTKEAQPDWVYAYTAWMKKRLEGRGITLIGQVRSKAGRSDFQCSSGHAWRTRPDRIAEGEGCPQCGIGTISAEDFPQSAKSACLHLLVNRERPGFIKIELTYDTSDQSYAENAKDGWEPHRYRNVDEPELAENTIWKLLGRPLPHDREPLQIDLSIAEEAFRQLIYEVRSEIALREKGALRSHGTSTAG